MNPDADLAAIAGLLADRHRADILLTLLGGTALSGSALAEAVGISRSLASAHLKKLVEGGLLCAKTSGRQRMYSIASGIVADAIETLSLLAPASQVRSLSEATRAKSLRWARMCYDHVAGTVGVAIVDALIGQGLVADTDGTYLITPDGAAGFTDLGIDVGRLENGTRPLIRPCMDWSERRYHLAGSLGAAITGEMFGRRWILHREASRIVSVTSAGHAGLRNWLGLDLDELRAAA